MQTRKSLVLWSDSTMVTLGVACLRVPGFHFYFHLPQNFPTGSIAVPNIIIVISTLFPRVLLAVTPRILPPAYVQRCREQVKGGCQVFPHIRLSALFGLVSHPAHLESSVPTLFPYSFSIALFTFVSSICWPGTSLISSYHVFKNSPSLPLGHSPYINTWISHTREKCCKFSHQFNDNPF